MTKYGVLSWEASKQSFSRKKVLRLADAPSSTRFSMWRRILLKYSPYFNVSYMRIITANTKELCEKSRNRTRTRELLRNFKWSRIFSIGGLFEQSILKTGVCS